MTVEHSTVEFREIPGFLGYRVSNTGIVQSCRVRCSGRLGSTWKTMSPSRTHGYEIVKLCDGMGKYKTRPVHTLILLAFAGPRPDPTVDARHLNGHKEDNFLENLAWGTKKQNAEDRERHGTCRKGEQHYRAKLTESIVVEIRARLRSGESVRKLARDFGVNETTIYRVKHGESWSHVT